MIGVITGTTPIDVISEHPKHHRVITGTAPIGAIVTAPIGVDRNRDLPDLDRDRDRNLAFICSDLMIFFWVLFVF